MISTSDCRLSARLKMDTVVADDRPLIQNTDDEDPIGGARVVIKQPKYRKITIEPVALLYFLGIVPQSLVIEQFVYGQFSSKYNFSSSDNQTQCMVNRSDPHYVTQQHIQALTSDWTLYNSLLSTLPAIVTTLFLGPHSDTTSRKLPLLIPLTGMLLANSYYAVVVSLNLDVPYILIGGFLGGLSGGFTTMLMGCFAYTADVSTHKKRTQHIVIMEIIIGTSYSATTVATGYMIKAIGLLWPIIVAIIFLVMGLLYVCLLLPETVARRQAMTSARLCSFSNVFRPFRILTKKTEFKYHRVIVALSLATLSLYIIALIGDTNVNLLYLQNAPLCFGVVVVTIYTAIKFCFPSYCGLIATFLLKNRLKDTGLMILGCLTGTTGALLFAFSTNIYMVFSGRFRFVYYHKYLYIRTTCAGI